MAAASNKSVPKLKKSELRQLCEINNLPTTGLKQELINRLLACPTYTTEQLKQLRPSRSRESSRRKATSPYFLFADDVRAETRAQFPQHSMSDLSKEIGKKWHALSDAQKKRYTEKAAQRQRELELEQKEAEQVNVNVEVEEKSQEVEHVQPVVLALSDISVANAPESYVELEDDREDEKLQELERPIVSTISRTDDGSATTPVQRQRRAPWSDEEVASLLSLKTSKTTQEIADILGRSRPAVDQKLRKLEKEEQVKEEKKRYQCAACDRVFDSERGLMSHIGRSKDAKHQKLRKKRRASVKRAPSTNKNKKTKAVHINQEKCLVINFSGLQL